MHGFSNKKQFNWQFYVKAYDEKGLMIRKKTKRNKQAG